MIISIIFRQPKSNIEKNDPKHEAGKTFYSHVILGIFKLLAFAINTPDEYLTK